MKFCFCCGRELPEDSGFCPYCGMIVSSPQVPVEPPPLPSKGAKILGYLGMYISFLPYTIFAVLWCIALSVKDALPDAVFFIVMGIDVALSISAVIISTIAMGKGYRGGPPRVGLIVGIVCTVLSLEYIFSISL